MTKFGNHKGKNRKNTYSLVEHYEKISDGCCDGTGEEVKEQFRIYELASNDLKLSTKTSVGLIVVLKQKEKRLSIYVFC